MILKNLEERQKEFKLFLLRWKISITELQKMRDRRWIKSDKQSCQLLRSDRKLKRWEIDESEKQDRERSDQRERNEMKRKNKKRSFINYKNSKWVLWKDEEWQDNHQLWIPTKSRTLDNQMHERLLQSLMIWCMFRCLILMVIWSILLMLILTEFWIICEEGLTHMKTRILRLH